MNLFEPGKTYWTATQDDNQLAGYCKGITTLAYADKMVLEQDFMVHERPELAGMSMRHVITIVPTTPQLRKMIDEAPEMFADLPGTPTLPGEKMADGLIEYICRFNHWLYAIKKRPFPL